MFDLQLFVSDYCKLACGPHGGVVVSTLDFRPEGRWFKAQSLPSYCFLRQEPFNPTLSPSTQVVNKRATGHILLGVTLRWTSIPSGGGEGELQKLG